MIVGHIAGTQHAMELFQDLLGSKEMTSRPWALRSWLRDIRSRPPWGDEAVALFTSGAFLDIQWLRSDSRACLRHLKQLISLNRR